MTRVMQVKRTGGPEVLTWEEMTLSTPGEGEVRLRHSAIGLNYIDVYFRSGLYPAELPFVPGLEAAGVVEAVGAGVSGLMPGDRVAYASPPLGAYSEQRVIQAKVVVKIPDGIGDEQAAAMMLKGMTAEYLLRRTFPVSSGDTILFHAAAGGVGLIACQWAKHLGATVIGTVGSDEKAELAAAHGCDHPIVYTRENVVERVRAITGGDGVPVVYDSVGKDTFVDSLDCLRPRGMLVLFGQSSGPVPPFEVATLSAKGSLYLTRPSLFSYVASREELEACANALIEVVLSRAVRIEVNQTFPLREAAAAHRALESRTTTGSTVLIP